MTDTTTACQKATIWEGPVDCLERDCDEYVTDDGYDRPGVTACSHVREVDICETHSVLAEPGSEWEHYTTTEPWPCKHQPA